MVYQDNFAMPIVPYVGSSNLTYAGLRFPPTVHRVTAATALTRNRFVATVADRVFVSHAAPGSKTEGFCREVLNSGKPLLTFESEENEGLLAMGARPLRLGDLAMSKASGSSSPP